MGTETTVLYGSQSRNQESVEIQILTFKINFLHDVLRDERRRYDNIPCPKKNKQTNRERS